MLPCPPQVLLGLLFKMCISEPLLMLLRVTVFMRCSKKLRRCLGTVTHTGVAKIRRLEHKLVNKSSAPAAAPAATCETCSELASTGQVCDSAMIDVPLSARS